MLDRAKKADIIRSGLNYWLGNGQLVLRSYGKEGDRRFADVESAVGDYANVSNEGRLADKFKTCLSQFALALWKLDGEDGLRRFNSVMEVALPAGYDAAYGDQRETGVDGFLTYVVRRDIMLGMKAGGWKTSDSKFSYWIEDPFAVLKDELTEDAYQVISTHGYVAIKMRYFFGSRAKLWHVHLEESPWRGKQRSLWEMEIPEGRHPKELRKALQFAAA